MRLTLALLAFVIPSVVAAPALKGKPTYYYATEVGTVLEYEMVVGAAMNQIITQTISAVEAKDGGLHVSIKHSTGGIDHSSKVFVTETGVTSIESAAKNNQQMLKLPAKANETWETTLANPAGAKVNHKTIGEEEIEVPAGKFKAIRVDMTYSLNIAGGMDMSQTYWFAPNVGLVKMQLNGGKAGLNFEQVLKSINTPKK